MNTKTKKVVASIVLGTFVVTTATPVFASDEMTETLPVQPVVVEQIEAGNIPPDAETNSPVTKLAKELAEKLLKKWDGMLNFLEDMQVEKGLIDALDGVKEVLLKALDSYNGTMTTAEGILADAIQDLGFEEDTAKMLAKFIFTFVI
ncbi:MAG: hypothetical protein J6A10_01275 [Peptococcaceae bacterium]|nr:hypothetical protein [Peptococcaceae bacterium]MBO5428585.1 hypothetical protein [Peptococcaceae bacterium]